jgi:hypothetical protein
VHASSPIRRKPDDRAGTANRTVRPPGPGQLRPADLAAAVVHQVDRLEEPAADTDGLGHGQQGRSLCTQHPARRRRVPGIAACLEVGAAAAPAWACTRAGSFSRPTECQVPGTRTSQMSYTIRPIREGSGRTAPRRAPPHRAILEGCSHYRGHRDATRAVMAVLSHWLDGAGWNANTRSTTGTKCAFLGRPTLRTLPAAVPVSRQPCRCHEVHNRCLHDRQPRI